MRLQRLTGLEQDKIVAEYREVMDTIADLLDILAAPSASPRSSRRADRHPRPVRRCASLEIVLNTADINIEDLIARRTWS
jgi:DNA gyrase subunit A